MFRFVLNTDSECPLKALNSGDLEHGRLKGGGRVVTKTKNLKYKKLLNILSSTDYILFLVFEAGTFAGLGCTLR